MDRNYRLKLEPDDNGTFLVTCPQFPEVTTFGETREDAAAEGLRAIEEAIAARIYGHQVVPLPGPVRRGPSVELPLLTFLKVGLYVTCRIRQVTAAELARRLGVHRNQVDRLFRLDHNSRLDQIEAAFRALKAPIEIGMPFLNAA
jgi:antitoxin HicB